MIVAQDPLRKNWDVRRVSDLPHLNSTCQHSQASILSVPAPSSLHTAYSPSSVSIPPPNPPSIFLYTHGGHNSLISLVPLAAAAVNTNHTVVVAYIGAEGSTSLLLGLRSNHTSFSYGIPSREYPLVSSILPQVYPPSPLHQPRSLMG
ncbi:hypothetical protein ONZ45_g7819 [Pleurotus djamor]|nr:hypothetical protein ONZ45_g7819 [Pleurotus djamor]